MSKSKKKAYKMLMKLNVINVKLSCGMEYGITQLHYCRLRRKGFVEQMVSME